MKNLRLSSLGTAGPKLSATRQAALLAAAQQQHEVQVGEPC